MSADTKDLKDVVRLVSHLGNAIGRSLADGKVTTMDLINFSPVIVDLAPAVVGIQKVPGQILALTEEQRAEIKDYLESEFDIPNDSLEIVLEKAFSIAIDLTEMVPHFRKK